MAMDQAETFEWLRQRSQLVDQLTSELNAARAELAEMTRDWNHFSEELAKASKALRAAAVPGEVPGEVRSAAERIMDWVAYRGESGKRPTVSGNDAQIVARFVLALPVRPTDDAEPAHVESMMRAAGFEVPDGGFGWCPVNFNAPLARGSMQLTLSLTKGHVRRLLAALGINLPVGPGEGGG